LSGPEGTVWTIRFAPYATLYERANDPLLLLRELALLGSMTVTAELTPLPTLAEFEPFGAYCAWTIELVSETVTEEAIREVFEFVDGDCAITIERSAALASTPELDDFPSFALLAEETQAERTFIVSGEPDNMGP